MPLNITFSLLGNLEEHQHTMYCKSHPGFSGSQQFTVTAISNLIQVSGILSTNVDQLLFAFSFTDVNPQHAYCTHGTDFFHRNPSMLNSIQSHTSLHRFFFHYHSINFTNGHPTLNALSSWEQASPFYEGVCIVPWSAISCVQISQCNHELTSVIHRHDSHTA